MKAVASLFCVSMIFMACKKQDLPNSEVQSSQDKKSAEDENLSTDLSRVQDNWKNFALFLSDKNIEFTDIDLIHAGPSSALDEITLMSLEDIHTEGSMSLSSDPMTTSGLSKSQRRRQNAAARKHAAATVVPAPAVMDTSADVGDSLDAAGPASGGGRVTFTRTTVGHADAETQTDPLPVAEVAPTGTWTYKQLAGETAAVAGRYVRDTVKEAYSLQRKDYLKQGVKLVASTAVGKMGYEAATYMYGAAMAHPYIATATVAAIGTAVAGTIAYGNLTMPKSAPKKSKALALTESEASEAIDVLVMIATYNGYDHLLVFKGKELQYAMPVAEQN